MKKDMPVGQCKLCLEAKELQFSHLIPRSFYKKARGTGRKGNQDPHALTREGRHPTSHQVTDYVLCRDCEDRFNRNGEDYVSRLITQQDGSFPLLEMLRAAPAIRQTAKFSAYRAEATPEINRVKLAYFGSAYSGGRPFIHGRKKAEGRFPSTWDPSTTKNAENIY
jgi:hypothetical protein